MNQTKRDSLSIVISAYNEEGNVAPLHRRLEAAVAGLGLEAVEYIFVNDGSTDGTLMRCQALQSADPKVKIVNFLRNFGHETAMMAGMDYAEGDAVLFMDADMQHPPECIPEMVELWRRGHDIVLSRRTGNADAGMLYRICAWMFYRGLNFLSDTPVPANTPDFRLIGRRYVDVLKSFDERGAMLRGMLGLVSSLENAAVIEFAAPARTSGESKYTLGKSIGLALDSVLQFSTKPLFLSLWLALLTTVLAVVFGVQVVVERYVLNNPTPGYATIVLTTLIMGAVNLVVLAIMGAYIARIHIETKKRPVYLADYLTAEGRRGNAGQEESAITGEDQ